MLRYLNSVVLVASVAATLVLAVMLLNAGEKQRATTAALREAQHAVTLARHERLALLERLRLVSLNDDFLVGRFPKSGQTVHID